MQIRHATRDGRMLRIADVSGLELTLMFIAANDGFEPKLRDAALTTNVGYGL